MNRASAQALPPRASRDDLRVGKTPTNQTRKILIQTTTIYIYIYIYMFFHNNNNNNNNNNDILTYTNINMTVYVSMRDVRRSLRSERAHCFSMSHPVSPSLSHSCPSPHSTPQPADSLNACRTNETSAVEMIVFPPYE